MRWTLALLVVTACGDASTTGYGTKGVTEDDTQDRSERDGGVLVEQDGGSIASPGDDDGDGITDAADCDPASGALRQRVVEDELATDKGLFVAAEGFPATSWMHDGTAYRQTRLLDAADVSAFTGEPSLGDVQVEVRTASTEVGAISPRLRQIFVLVGAASSGGSLVAHGCGIEVIEGQTPEQKTSIVKLAGPPSNITTTTLQRVTRPAVQANEQATIKLRLEDGVMICDVTQGSATTTTATAPVGSLVGRVGFFTRQTKALFKSVRVCKLK